MRAIGSIFAEAISSLLTHPLRSLLTALSVTFGASVLFVLLSYVTGVPETTATILRSMGSKEFTIEAKRSRGRNGGGTRSGRKIQIRYTDLDKIRSACPSIEGLAPAYRPGRGGPVYASDRSWPWAALSGVGQEYQHVTDMRIVTGRWFEKAEELGALEVALISLPLAEGMFDGRSPLGEQIDAWGKRFEVIGVFESTSSFAYSVMVPYPTTMDMGDSGGRFVSHIAFAPRSLELAEQSINEIKEALGSIYSFDAHDPAALEVKENMAFTAQVEATSLALEAMALVIGAIALLLGSLGAANVVGIAVAERTAELGLRKALGATASRVRAEVLTETVLLSIFGGALGVALGWSATLALGPLEFADEARLEPQANMSLLMIAVGILLVSAVVAGMPAANRAARLEPAVALREQ